MPSYFEELSEMGDIFYHFYKAHQPKPDVPKEGKLTLQSNQWKQFDQIVKKRYLDSLLRIQNAEPDVPKWRVGTFWRDFGM
jgi:hypothetical protein